MLAGRACVYADFLGYDEVAHHSGIERFDALAVLRVDRPADRPPAPGHAARAPALPHRRAVRPRPDPGHAVRRPLRRVRRGAGRPAVRGRSREPRRRGSEREARRPAEGWQIGAAVRRGDRPGGGPIARRLRERVERAGSAEDRPRTATGLPARSRRVAPGVVVVSSGHVAMVSFTEHAGRVELETIERSSRTCCPRWSTTTASGSCSCAAGRVRAGGARPRRRAPARTGDACSARTRSPPYGPHAADLIRRVDGFPHCPDVLINSRYDPVTDDASPFEPHVGSARRGWAARSRAASCSTRPSCPRRGRSSGPRRCTASSGAG